jgi:hypothetical protein
MEVSPNAVLIVWGGSLILGLVVIGVVAFLLHQIRNTAREIEEVVADIWIEGKLVANNTIQIPLFLTKTNRVVARIYGTAGQIVAGSRAIEQHADGCPGCPACVIKSSTNL